MRIVRYLEIAVFKLAAMQASLPQDVSQTAQKGDQIQNLTNKLAPAYTTHSMTAQVIPQSTPPIYLIRRRRSSPSNRIRSNWSLKGRSKKLITMSLVSVISGMIAGAYIGTAAPKSTGYPLTSGAVATQPANPAKIEAAASNVADAAVVDKSSRDLERLKSRNRRLEALVSVLRARAAHGQSVLPMRGADQTVVVVK